MDLGGGGFAKWMPGLVPVDPIAMQGINKVASPQLQKAINPIGSMISGDKSKPGFLAQVGNSGLDYGAKEREQQRQSSADDAQRNRISLAGGA